MEVGSRSTGLATSGRLPDPADTSVSALPNSEPLDFVFTKVSNQTNNSGMEIVIPDDEMIIEGVALGLNLSNSL